MELGTYGPVWTKQVVPFTKMLSYRPETAFSQTYSWIFYGPHSPLSTHQQGTNLDENYY